jgi:hypothetical protein
MYTDIADEILDDILDKLYVQGNKVYNNKNINNIEIDKFINKFMSSYHSEKLDTYSDKDIQKQIKCIYSEYVFFYILVNISALHSEKDFVKLVISLNKTSIVNSKLLNISLILRQINYIVKNVKNITDKKIILDHTYDKTLKIYNDLSELFTSNLKSKDIFHSVIKYILFQILFVNHNKSQVYSIIEEYELNLMESKFIEIVETTTQKINYVTLEKLLSDEKYDLAFINDVYDMLLNDDDEEKMSLDDKIKLIFKRKMLIPITDEFLRYNKNTELYDHSTNIDANVRSNKKNNTKIKYIINKMNDVIDFYKNKNCKNFYQPLIYRKATLVNNSEEMDILKKLGNTQNKTDDQISHQAELLLLRKYPYQNFRDFKSYGFEFENDEGIDSIRYSNIEYLNDPKYEFAKNNIIDWRTMITETYSNIVGVALPNEIGKKSFLTNTIAKLVNIDDGKHSNISNIIRMFKKQLIMNTSYNKINYWIFDKEKDIMKKFNEISNFPQDEYFKFILGYIYDEMAELTYEKIINALSTEKFTTFNDVLNLINSMEKQYITLTDDKRHKLYQYIFTQYSPQHEDIYDIKEDYIPGQKQPLIPLSESHNINDINIVPIIRDIKDISEAEVDHYEHAHCQHLLTWNRIKRLRMNNPNKYAYKLQLFVKEFVMENMDKEFICKSCSELVDLKRYLADWTSSTEEGISITLSLQTSLEKIPEYEKFSVAIKNMERIMEKISGSVALSHFIGAKRSAQTKRQESIRMMIDLMNAQSEKMKKLDINDRAKIKADSLKKYGISLSQFFMFELKNEIFTYSSKEVDKYKKPKLNNIVTYIILVMLLEIKTNVILGFSKEKMLNYYIFEKIGFNLFDGLFIRINSANDISPIKNYKLLCYVIFMLSGFVVKYNMWFSDNTSKKSLINALDQKIVIHTMIGILNNILDFNNQNTTDYIYEYYGKKFFTILHDVFTGKEADKLIVDLKEQIDKKITVISTNKIIFKTSEERETVLKNYFEKDDFGTYLWPNSVPPYIMNKFRHTLCTKDVFTDKEYELMRKKYKYDINKTKKNLSRSKKIHNNDYEYDIENLGSDLYEHVERMITNWEKIIGENVRINNTNLYLRNNVYTIDHDYYGKKSNKVMTFTDADNAIIFKKNDLHFKANVYYYFDKEKDIYMYYNSRSFNYMGYRSGKDYYNIINTNANLLPIYSIKHKLLFLGYTNLNYPMDKEMSEYVDSDINVVQGKMRKFVSDIIRNRVKNLKNSLVNIQRIINQLFTNNKKLKNEQIAKNFYKKFKDLTIVKNGDRIFDNINEIINTSFFTKLDKNIKITFEKDYLYAGNLIKVLNTDQKLIMYICNEFDKFLSINNDEHTKITLIYLFSNIINQEFNFHNYRETSMALSDVKRFMTMESNVYTKIEIQEVDIFNGLNDEEADDLRDELLDEKEMNDAIDVDFDEDSTQLADSYGNAN